MPDDAPPQPVDIDDSTNMRSQVVQGSGARCGQDRSQESAFWMTRTSRGQVSQVLHSSTR
jgi:hypothetical protein